MSKINIKYFPCFQRRFEIYDLKDFLIKYLIAVLLSFSNCYTFGPWQAVRYVPASSPHTFYTICHQYDTEGNNPCFQWQPEIGGGYMLFSFFPG